MYGTFLQAAAEEKHIRICIADRFNDMWQDRVGIVSLILYGFTDKPFTGRYLLQAPLTAIPGIILQIVVIPVLIIALKRGNLLRNE